MQKRKQTAALGFLIRKAAVYYFFSKKALYCEKVPVRILFLFLIIQLGIIVFIQLKGDEYNEQMSIA